MFIGFLSAALLIVAGPARFMSTDEVRAAAGLSEPQLLQLKKGQVLMGVQQAGQETRGTVAATVLIDAPPESVWRVLVDCREAPTFVPGLKACQVLDAGQNWEIIRHEVKWTWFLPRISYVFRAIYRPYRRIDFVGIGGDLREMKGTWRLAPYGGGRRTIVRYSVFLDPEFYIPQWFVRHALKTDLPDILTALRTRVMEK